MRNNRIPRNPKAKSILGKWGFLFLPSRDTYCVCNCVGCAEALLWWCGVSTTSESGCSRVYCMHGLQCLPGFMWTPQCVDLTKVQPWVPPESSPHGSVLSQLQTKACPQALLQPLLFVVSLVLIDNPAGEWVHFWAHLLWGKFGEALNIWYRLEVRRRMLSVRSLSTPRTPDPNGRYVISYDLTMTLILGLQSLPWQEQRKSRPWVKGLLARLPQPPDFSGQGYTEGEKGRHPASHVLLCGVCYDFSSLPIFQMLGYEWQHSSVVGDQRPCSWLYNGECLWGKGGWAEQAESIERRERKGLCHSCIIFCSTGTQIIQLL